MLRAPLLLNQHTCERLHLSPNDVVHASACVRVCVMRLCKQFQKYNVCRPLWKLWELPPHTLKSPFSPNTHAPLICLLFHSTRLTSHTHTPLCCPASSLGLPLPPHRLSGYCVTLDMGRAWKRAHAGPSQHLQTYWLSHWTGLLSLDLQSG